MTKRWGTVGGDEPSFGTKIPGGLYEDERPTSNVQRPILNNDVASLPKIMN